MVFNRVTLFKKKLLKLSNNSHEYIDALTNHNRNSNKITITRTQPIITSAENTGYFTKL